MFSNGNKYIFFTYPFVSINTYFILYAFIYIERSTLLVFQTQVKKPMLAKQKNTLKDDKKGFTNLVPLVLTIIIAFALIFIGAFVNGEIHTNIIDSMNPGASGNESTEIYNTTLSGLNNTSSNWDSTLDIVQIVVIITVLAAAIGAIFLFTRYR